jgi:hypothetical protein
MFAKPATRLAPVAGISRGELQVAFFLQLGSCQFQTVSCSSVV